MIQKWLHKWSKTATKGEHTPKTDSYLLIEGLFSPSEAADVLLSLLNDKIKFHSVQLLNLQHPDCQDSLNSKNRIVQLKKAKEEITTLIVQAKNEGQILQVHSTIEISKSAPSTSQTSQNPAG